MKTITYQAAEREDETVSAFLMMVFEYGREIGLYGLLGSRLNSLVWKSRTGRSWLAAWCSIVGSAANRLPVASIIRNAKLCVMHIHAASRPGTR